MVFFYFLNINIPELWYEVKHIKHALRIYQNIVIAGREGEPPSSDQPKTKEAKGEFIASIAGKN